MNSKSDGVMVLNIQLDYIENLLNTLITVPGQKILILDENNNIICGNGSYRTGDKIDISQFKNSNVVSELKSDQYNIKYLSVIPKTYLYSVPKMLFKLTLILLTLSFFIGLVTAYYITKRNYNSIRHIINIIEDAKVNNILTPLPSPYTDEYSYITYNILKVFLEENYLKVQLSEKKYRMQAMQLLALQSQINPHFLFNTLETINLRTLALTGKPNEVNEIIQNLSQILKYSLSNPSETISLKNEIENTMSYIYIQKMRYKDKFKVIWQNDSDLLHYNVMKLLFQPLIENSIYHGIKEKEGKSTIKIKIGRLSNEMKITVIDNGIGISREKLSQIRNQLEDDFEYSQHIGLMNTNERLKLIYGSQYNIVIRSKLGMGTAIYITIPI